MPVFGLGALSDSEQEEDKMTALADPCERMVIEYSDRSLTVL